MPDDDKPAAAPRPPQEPKSPTVPSKDKGMHEVDQTTQEQASKEREKSGGYD